MPVPNMQFLWSALALFSWFKFTMRRLNLKCTVKLSILSFIFIWPHKVFCIISMDDPDKCSLSKCCQACGVDEWVSGQPPVFNSPQCLCQQYVGWWFFLDRSSPQILSKKVWLKRGSGHHHQIPTFLWKVFGINHLAINRFMHCFAFYPLSCAFSRRIWLCGR